MTIKLKIEHPNGQQTAWGDFDTVDQALYVGEVAKARMSDLFTAELIVEHTVTSLESIMLGVPYNTIIRYQVA